MPFRWRLIFLAFLAVLAIEFPASDVMAAEEDGVMDMTEILRSLAKIRYLPEHGGPGATVDLYISFELNSANLPPESARQLDELALAITAQNLSGQKVRIAGHTDARGNNKYNLDLSLRRAQSVLGYLVDKHDLSAERFEVVGFGEKYLKNPLSPEADENRRVEIVLLGNPNNSSSDDLPVRGDGEIDIKW